MERDTRVPGDARAVGRDIRDDRTRDVPDVRVPLDRPAPGYVPAGAVGAAPSTETGGDARDRSIGDLLKELRDESSVLMRQELALAKTEMSEKASSAARDAVAIATGGVVTYLGALFLLIGLTVGLAMLLDAAGMDEHAWWVSPLIVGAILAIVGYSMLKKGTDKLKQTSPVPEKTVQSLQEDKQWLQEKVK